MEAGRAFHRRRCRPTVFGSGLRDRHGSVRSQGWATTGLATPADRSRPVQPTCREGVPSCRFDRLIGSGCRPVSACPVFGYEPARRLPGPRAPPRPRDSSGPRRTTGAPRRHGLRAPQQTPKAIGAAGLPCHGWSRRLAWPSPECIGHGTPPGHRRALIGRLDGWMGGDCRRAPSPAASPCRPRIQSSAVSAVRLKGRGIVRGPPDGRCVVDGRPCGRGGVGQFPRTGSRFDRLSRLDSRAAILRTGRRLAAPRGVSDGRSVRGSGPAEEPWPEGTGS